MGSYQSVVCNFKSMKNPVELKSLLLKLKDEIESFANQAYFSNLIIPLKQQLSRLKTANCKVGEMSLRSSYILSPECLITNAIYPISFITTFNNTEWHYQQLLTFKTWYFAKTLSNSKVFLLLKIEYHFLYVVMEAMKLKNDSKFCLAPTILTILTEKNYILLNLVQEWLIGCFWTFSCLHN